MKRGWFKWWEWLIFYGAATVMLLWALWLIVQCQLFLHWWTGRVY